MTDEHLLKNIDSLLFQCALQTRELTQKKNEINQQIKVCRADIAEARSNIEANKRSIKSLEEDIKAKENTLAQSKALAKSMRATNSMLLHYEQTLKTELESRKATYNHDREQYEKRIAAYRATFQSQKEYYYSNPLAQKLLGLQAENREIEARIKGYDDQITYKQEELDKLRAINSTSQEIPPESISEKLSEKEPEKQQELETEEGNNLSFQNDQIKTHPVTSEEISEDKSENDRNTSMSNISTEEADRSPQQMEEETETQEKNQESVAQDQAWEQEISVPEIEQAMEEEMEEGSGVEVDQTINREADETLASLSQASSQDTNLQASPASAKTDHVTPEFPFTFSPGRSPQASDSNKSPAFSFNLHSEPSTPGFFGFGIDVGSAQEEDSTFSSSFFGEKKTTESKTSMEFLFQQPVQSEDFQFSFNAKSVGNKDQAGDDFPFSFNF